MIPEFQTGTTLAALAAVAIVAVVALVAAVAAVAAVFADVPVVAARGVVAVRAFFVARNAVAVPVAVAVLAAFHAAADVVVAWRWEEASESPAATAMDLDQEKVTNCDSAAAAAAAAAVVVVVVANLDHSACPNQGDYSSVGLEKFPFEQFPTDVDARPPFLFDAAATAAAPLIERESENFLGFGSYFFNQKKRNQLEAGA